MPAVSSASVSGSGNAGGGLRRVDYAQALEIQHGLVRRRAAGEIPDLVWYLEHPPVVTWGSKGGAGHLRRPVEEIAGRGIQVLPTERGGDITWHGPGQLVGYPIVALGQDRDLHRYLRSLEEALIGALAEHRIPCGPVAGRTGVWTGGAKIAAIGVRVSHWIASHGFALNIDCDLSGFDLIVPCGIADAGVTSMALELARQGLGTPPALEVVASVHRHLERVLGRPLRKVLEAP